MRAGTIIYNGHDLSLLGMPEITVTRTPDLAPPSKSTRYLHDVSLTQTLTAKMPSTLWARVEELNRIFQTTEGHLEIHDENGLRSQLYVMVGRNTLPDAIRNRRTTYTVELQGWSSIDQPSGADATYEEPGQPAFLFHHVTSFAESINTERRDERLGNRSLTTATISFNARSYIANPATNPSDRLTSLIQQKETLEHLQGKEGRFRYGPMDRQIQVTSIQCRIDDSCHYLDLTIQARSIALPGDSQVEVEFNITSTEEQCGPGESNTRISGTVEAFDRATAQAKVDEIASRYGTSTRTLKRKEINDLWFNGIDSLPEDSWRGLSFTLEYRELTAFAWSLTVDETDDISGCRQTYSGTIQALDLTSAMAFAEDLAGQRAPMLIRSQLTTETESSCLTEDSILSVIISGEDAGFAAGVYHWNAAQLQWELDTPTHFFEILQTGRDFQEVWLIRGGPKNDPDKSFVTSTPVGQSTNPGQVTWPDQVQASELPARSSEFVRLRFTYEYLCPSDHLHAEVTTQINDNNFQDSTAGITLKWSPWRCQ